MKDNIDSSSVLNRKIVLELRYTPNPIFLDKRGSLLSAIKALDIFKAEHWGIDDTAITIADYSNNLKSRKHIHIGINRLGFISSRIDSIDSFYQSFIKVYEKVKELLGDLDIKRIGCRIQGTYNTKSKSYDDILNNFKSSFSNKFLLETFPVKDCRIQINYQNGNYNIGPINIDDEFVFSQFQYEDKKNTIGMGIDTDNYVLKTDSILNSSMIKDVYVASLSVEKALYDLMKDF